MVTRKLQFSGALFDGQSANKHPVQIKLTPRHISLTVQGGAAVNWPYSNLRWTAETIPFQIEHESDTPAGKRLETLVVEDPDFYENCNQIAPEEFSRTKNRNAFNWKIFFSGILILVIFLYGTFKVFPDYLVNQFVDEIPVEWEEALGNAILSAFPVDKNPDEEIISLLQNILRLLKHNAPEDTPYNLKIHILPTKQINALALPGGNIIIFEGLLRVADSPEELAGVLAHEAQHIFLKHSTRGILRNFASKMLLALVMGDANVVLDGMLNMTEQLNSLGLNRKMEFEADAKGMDLMLDAKINPQGMLTIFKKLLKEELKEQKIKTGNSSSENSNKLFSYLSTHPLAENRLAKLEEQIKNNSGRLWIPLYPDSQWEQIKPKS